MVKCQIYLALSLVLVRVPVLMTTGAMHSVKGKEITSVAFLINRWNSPFFGKVESFEF